jgi:hypothetical protein
MNYYCYCTNTHRAAIAQHRRERLQQLEDEFKRLTGTRKRLQGGAHGHVQVDAVEGSELGVSRTRQQVRAPTKPVITGNIACVMQ